MPKLKTLKTKGWEIQKLQGPKIENIKIATLNGE